MEKQWYAVYTKPRWEKKVAESLMKNCFESYCPLNRVVRQWSDRKKMIEEPLFTSYVFVQLLPKELTEVRKIDGVVNFVYWLGKPAIIRDAEIQDIKDFLINYRNVQLEKTAVRLNDVVQVINGPLLELKGQVISVNQKVARIAVKSLGLTMVAEISRQDLKLVAQAEMPA